LLFNLLATLAPFLRKSYIFVGTGEIELSVTLDQASGQRQTNSSYSGPVLEVVVTRETVVYRDETRIPSPGAGAVSGAQTVQQVVKLVDSLDELGENTKNTFKIY
jgi:hypothetical protein